MSRSQPKWVQLDEKKWPVSARGVGDAGTAIATVHAIAGNVRLDVLIEPAWRRRAMGDGVGL